MGDQPPQAACASISRRLAGFTRRGTSFFGSRGPCSHCTVIRQGRCVVKIIDLTEEFLPLYLVCLEDWSDALKEPGNLKRVWYNRMVERGLRVKLALNDRGIVGGMIQYVPIEYSVAGGTDLYFINCIWVHGHKQGRGNFQRQGMGSALLGAAEADARGLGAKGMVGWGLILPAFMRASWFKKHGYQVVDRQGIQALLWKPFTEDARPPHWRKQKPDVVLEPSKVTVTAYCSGWCPAQNLAFERVRRAVAEPEFEGKIVLREFDTGDPSGSSPFPMSDALFINDKQIRTGPPPSYERIRTLIRRKAKRILPGSRHHSH